jgi:crotonobetainyl-CoA:carnitine CoA-transferase CaiB-like acyl-CoA transferase
MASDERFATNKARVAHRVEVRSLLIAETSKWSKTALLAACGDNAVPAGPINSIGEMFDDPQVRARKLRIDLPDADGNVIPGVRSPIVLSETPLAYGRPSPRLGEHTDEVMMELIISEMKKAAKGTAE